MIRKRQTPQLTEPGCSWVFEVEQAPWADIAKGPLAFKPLLEMPVQLSQHRKAVVPVPIGEDEVGIGVHEAPAFEVDEVGTVQGQSAFRKAPLS